jgi:hypothetical protein
MRPEIKCLVVSIALLLVACGQEPVADAGSTASASTPAASAPEKKAPLICGLITLEEMKALMGSDQIVATPDDGGGGLKCTWAPPEGGLPMAELTIEKGSGEVAMTAFGMLGKMEPGINNPYDGLGDQAVASGPSVMIRKGEDLYTIMYMGGGDHDAAVRKIYETASANLKS